MYHRRSSPEISIWVLGKSSVWTESVLSMDRVWYGTHSLICVLKPFDKWLEIRIDKIVKLLYFQSIKIINKSNLLAWRQFGKQSHWWVNSFPRVKTRSSLCIEMNRVELETDDDPTSNLLFQTFALVLSSTWISSI